MSESEYCIFYKYKFLELHKMNRIMTNSLILRIALVLLLLPSTFLFAQNVSINADGALPDSSAILDIASTTSGLLIPRMTTAQRDSIVAPPIGLQVFNLSTSTLDIYRSTGWASVAFTPQSATNLVYVSSLADLPAPSGGAILLDGTKMYIFSGFVDISPNYLNLNGAGLRGTDPGKDGVMSTVAGGVLRSADVSVFIENLAVIPASGSTKAYDFVDATGAQFCNLFSGSSVVEIGIPSLGVGQISGFRAITVEKNYWSCKDGIKITGNVGKFVAFLNYISISAGIGIEFLPGLIINDIDLSNNYFTFTGQIGVSVNAGSSINNGRMTTNMFRGVTTLLSGFDSYSFGWQMQQNTGIPDTRSFAYAYMDGNTAATTFPSVGTYTKILGTTTLITGQKFTASNNRLTYIGKENIIGRVFATIGARAPGNATEYTIAIAKNGVVINAPTSSLGPLSNNQGFQIVLETEVIFSTGDYIEVFIRSNAGTLPLVVADLQFRVVE